MEAVTLTRQDLKEGLEKIDKVTQKGSYVEGFKVTFPEGMNTADVIEICRAIQEPTFENKIHLLKICMRGKNVEVTCPNGDIEKFCMNNIDDDLDAFPLFQKEPLALIAITDNLYGYLLKKYVRL
jgi:hypothetical protein